MYFLSVFNAAIAVVMLPAQGSRIRSPGSVYVRIRYSIKATGFWVGWIADFWISFGNFKTDLGYLLSES